MKHVFTSSIADGTDATLVRPSNWNDTHVMSIAAISTSTTLAATNDYVACTGGLGGISVTLPGSARTGQQYTIKKVDAAVGAITVVGTIDGVANYILVVQNQYVVIVWDGSTWNIIGNN